MEQKVKQIIEDKLGLSSNNYTPESKFKEDLGCDSLDMIDLVMECEREFNVVIPDDVAANDINTVQDLINYIKEHSK